MPTETEKSKKVRDAHLRRTRRRMLDFDNELFSEAMGRLEAISDEEWARAEAEDDHAS